MGCLPMERTTNIMGGNDCIADYNNVALEFNGKLNGLTTNLNKELPGLKLVFSNPYYIFLHMIRRPSLYGKSVTCIKCALLYMFYPTTTQKL